jgi:hypothetical protein
VEMAQNVFNEGNAAPTISHDIDKQVSIETPLYFAKRGKKVNGLVVRRGAPGGL